MRRGIGGDELDWAGQDTTSSLNSLLDGEAGSITIEAGRLGAEFSCATIVSFFSQLHQGGKIFNRIRYSAVTGM